MADHTDHQPAGILPCTLCDQKAVARLSVHWLCADHILIELADRIGATYD